MIIIELTESLSESFLYINEEINNEEIYWVDQFIKTFDQENFT